MVLYTRHYSTLRLRLQTVEKNRDLRKKRETTVCSKRHSSSYNYVTLLQSFLVYVWTREYCCQCANKSDSSRRGQIVRVYGIRRDLVLHVFLDLRPNFFNGISARKTMKNLFLSKSRKECSNQLWLSQRGAWRAPAVGALPQTPLAYYALCTMPHYA